MIKPYIKKNIVDGQVRFTIVSDECPENIILRQWLNKNTQCVFHDVSFVISEGREKFESYYQYYIK